MISFEIWCKSWNDDDDTKLKTVALRPPKSSKSNVTDKENKNPIRNSVLLVALLLEMQPPTRCVRVSDFVFTPRPSTTFGLHSVDESAESSIRAASAMLVGDCGVGKTTLLWQFAVNAARSRLNVWLTALLEQKKKSAWIDVHKPNATITQCRHGVIVFVLWPLN